MATRTEFEIAEGTTFPVTTTLTSDGTTPIPLADIQSLTMTFLLQETGEIINGRSNQDILNANDVTVHATSGLVTWQVQPEDVAIVGSVPVGLRERHLATIACVVISSKPVLPIQIEFAILNLRSFPLS